jgi:hypothetical protein
LNFVNEELLKIQGEVETNQKKVKDQVIKIKLQEVLKNIKPVEKTEKITDAHLVNLMQYYDLVAELRTL